MKKLIAVLVFCAAVTAGVWVPQAHAQPAPSGQYKIGDKGPAGGIVFYDKENNSNGWRYLEAAPVDLQGTLQWCLGGVGVAGTKTGIGTGKKNTELIIAALNQKGESGRAAQLCKAYTLNGYNDWFLPSKDELNELYKNGAYVGNLKTTVDWTNLTHIYWSSSQFSTNLTWSQYFSNGFQGNYNKNITLTVRAVRQF